MYSNNIVNVQVSTTILNVCTKKKKVWKLIDGSTYLAQTITDVEYADDTTLLANTSANAEILQHSLERVAAGIGFHDNADKTEYMCFNQRGEISTLNGSSLKLVDKFTCLGSSVSSTEKDINT